MLSPFVCFKIQLSKKICTFISNYRSFDFFTLSFIACLIQKICTNIIKFKLIFKKFLLKNQVKTKNMIFCTVFQIRPVKLEIKKVKGPTINYGVLRF